MREREVYTLTVVAEDRGLGESNVKLKESVVSDGKNKIAKVLEEFKEQLDGFDGKYTGGSMSIELEADAKDIFGQVAVPEHWAQAMMDFKQPVTKQDMMSFLGTIGYYRRFVEGFSTYSSLLTRKGSK